MKLIGKIILIAILFICIPSVMAFGIMLCKSNGVELDGSGRFWYIMIVTVVCSMSLGIQALQIIGTETKNK